MLHIDNIILNTSSRRKRKPDVAFLPAWSSAIQPTNSLFIWKPPLRKELLAALLTITFPFVPLFAFLPSNFGAGAERLGGIYLLKLNLVLLYWLCGCFYIKYNSCREFVGNSLSLLLRGSGCGHALRYALRYTALRLRDLRLEPCEHTHYQCKAQVCDCCWEHGFWAILWAFISVYVLFVKDLCSPEFMTGWR